MAQGDSFTQLEQEDGTNNTVVSEVRPASGVHVKITTMGVVTQDVSNTGNRSEIFTKDFANSIDARIGVGDGYLLAETGESFDETNVHIFINNDMGLAIRNQSASDGEVIGFVHGVQQK